MGIYGVEYDLFFNFEEVQQREAMMKKLYQAYLDRLDRIGLKFNPSLDKNTQIARGLISFDAFCTEWNHVTLSTIREELYGKPPQRLSSGSVEWTVEDAFQAESRAYHLPKRKLPTLDSYDRRRDLGQYQGRYGIWARF